MPGWAGRINDPDQQLLATASGIACCLFVGEWSLLNSQIQFLPLDIFIHIMYITTWLYNHMVIYTC